MPRSKNLIPVLIFALAMGIPAGCASHTETRTTETTTTEPAQLSETETKTTTTTTEESGHDSLLGATAHFVGTVIAFPFRVVGDVLGEIF